MGAAVLLCGLVGAVPARANIIFTPTFDASINSDPNAAAIKATINQAIVSLESQYTTLIPLTVNITYKEINSGLPARKQHRLLGPFPTTSIWWLFRDTPLVTRQILVRLPPYPVVRTTR